MNNFCEQCGAKLREGAAFCSKCGALTGLQDKNNKEKKADKKAVIISIAVAGAVLLLAFIAVVPYLRSDTYQCKKNIKLAQRSYKEEKYDESLSYCKEALAMDKTYVDAYLKLADIYLEKGEYLSAVLALTDGRKETGDKTLAEREEYLREHIVVVNKKYHYDDGSIFENAYDEYGIEEIKNVKYNSDGSVESREEAEIEYDEFGNMIKSVWYSDGSVDCWGEGECDESENLIKWVLYDSETGGIIKWREFEHDEYGNVIKKIWCWDDGSVGSWEVYEYDESGNKIKEVDYDWDGSVESWWETEYDKSGNMIKHVNDYYSLLKFEYDESGNLIKEVYGHTYDRSEDWWYEYIYDEFGNLTKKERHNSDGSVGSWEEYKRDIMGNIISSRKYDGYSSNYECEYQYTYISEEIKRKRDVYSQM